ncbi:hypothetical protein ACSYAY_06665 [Leptospirillum ferriphilum]|uniref:hypothetical protein n=1 Tax=Leptospirillum ferriphilum TaxID=178606 RepID=UPI003EE57367
MKTQPYEGPIVETGKMTFLGSIVVQNGNETLRIKAVGEDMIEVERLTQEEAKE